MRIAILSRNPKLYSTRRLVEAGTALGHQVDVIDTMHCYMDITSSRPSVRYKGKPLPYYDAVIPRIGASVTFYGTSVVRQFEMMGTFSINESVAISRSRDKLRSLQLLSRKGIGMPRTGFAHHPDKIDDLIKNVGGGRAAGVPAGGRRCRQSREPTASKEQAAEGFLNQQIWRVSLRPFQTIVGGHRGWLDRCRGRPKVLILCCRRLSACGVEQATDLSD